MHNFALIGAAGYIAPRHMQAIKETGNNLSVALDHTDSVGILDRFFPSASFFTEFERFDRHVEKLRRGPPERHIRYVSICSPNYLHDAHIRFALRVGADAICEKPLVLEPWNVDALQEIESETTRRIWAILQLRLHPSIIALRRQIEEAGDRIHDIDLTYITSRGLWYGVSWKGIDEKSGGVAMNIGVHFFDMLIWIFGPVQRSTVHFLDGRRGAGLLELQRARVRWFLSVDGNDLPPEAVSKGRSTYRALELDGTEFEFSDGFTDLHTQMYREILAGRGFGVDDVRPSIQLVHDIRHAHPMGWQGDVHPLACKKAVDQ
jgi:UDP-N-acetyl-2-amino-2-deoxyglucuronate dehydrogenase